MKINNTYEPYKVISREPIQYSTCRDFSHISRYKGLRQVVHEADNPDRYIALETTNPFKSNSGLIYYTVPASLENRLDIIAYNFLGSAQYAWIIAYFNDIDDGYTVHEGQRIAIPRSVSSLFNSGEILAPIAATKLNLGSE